MQLGQNYRELKQRRRQRERKRHPKSEFALLQAWSPLSHIFLFFKCWRYFQELNFKGLYLRSQKKKGNGCRGCQKRDARAKLLFCQSKHIGFLPFSLPCCLVVKFPIGSFSNDDGDGNENVKTAMGLLSKTTSLHVHHAFLYISLPLLHVTTRTWKCLISHFMEDVNKRRRNFLSLS